MAQPSWKIHELREHAAVLDGKQAPNLVITNATYLHGIYKTWLKGNIWISGDRIIYAGAEMPKNTEGTEITDASGKVIVPGYIEPHVHPFQLYNPLTFADYASRRGTTTFISDNSVLFLSMENWKAFAILDQLKERPFSFYWWARFDSQTQLDREEELYTNQSVGEWIARPDVLMGGELTAWPRLVAGDDQMLLWMQQAKDAGMKVEGHFPGASERTLARLKLLGADGDHEAMTVDEVENRLLHGYAVTLRHSSIRPDLPDLLKGILERKLDVFDHLMMTTDGSTPSFHEDGVMDKCIRVALDAGVKPEDAYAMASYNVAKYYDMDDLHGLIATGRYANLNFLESPDNPVPTDVLSKGVWLRRDGEDAEPFEDVDWSWLEPFDPAYELDDYDFQFSFPFGIELVNDVITKPYSVDVDPSDQRLPAGQDQSFLLLIDRNGKWRVNTLVKGFADDVQGFASSYSSTGDIILIGKNAADMKLAFDRLKEIGGGIALTEHGEVISELPLDIGGVLSSQPLPELIENEKELKAELRKRGYRHGDAVYTLLFLMSTHLPYVRITQKGIYDVMNRKILFPALMR
ncbi:adenine deaminase C-terminal domain-containing protein [Bhargavaea cecembensis]|uniref:adenine deaminase C-terminal domain-containing protein n=1 Tax=Bhargavaea cecembensis TaxID=394098 RepID=UPI00058F65A7|nr:adenine deaminase C-terminal domain-containing protein [Bhargavaea cecembensis]